MASSDSKSESGAGLSVLSFASFVLEFRSNTHPIEHTHFSTQTLVVGPAQNGNIRKLASKIENSPWSRI